MGIGPDRRRGWAVVAASALAHLAVLIAVGLATPRPDFHLIATEPTLTVQLIPRIAALQTHEVAPSPSERNPSSASAPAPLLRPHVLPPSAPAPTTPSPIIAPPAPGAPTPPHGNGTSLAPAPLPFEDGKHGVHAMLRDTIGCSHPEGVHLTEAEREACDQRFGAAAKTAVPFSGIDPLKRGRFDDQVAADDRKRQMREGNVQQIVPCTGNGSNFGVGCLPESAMMHSRQH